jgi:hypothetical protein
MGQNPNLLSICEGAMNMNFGFYKFEKKKKPKILKDSKFAKTR